MYMRAKADEHTGEYWECAHCQTVMECDYSSPEAAAEHVTETGHTVTIVRTQQYEIYAMRYDVMPEESRG